MNKRKSEPTLKINDKVLVLQEDAPYDFYGKTGRIVGIDYEKGVYWFQVQIKPNNPNEPYESWFLEEHLKTPEQLIILTDDLMHDIKAAVKAVSGNRNIDEKYTGGLWDLSIELTGTTGEFQEEVYNYLWDIYEKIKQTKRVCKRCGEFVTETDHPDYMYECPYCDEHLYGIETEMVDVTGHKVGECPVCKGNLTYTKIVTSGLKEGHAWKCENCDSQGIEWKEMRFVGHQIVFNSTE